MTNLGCLIQLACESSISAGGIPFYTSFIRARSAVSYTTHTGFTAGNEGDVHRCPCDGDVITSVHIIFETSPESPVSIQVGTSLNLDAEEVYASPEASVFIWSPVALRDTDIAIFCREVSITSAVIPKAVVLGVAYLDLRYRGQFKDAYLSGAVLTQLPKIRVTLDPTHISLALASLYQDLDVNSPGVIPRAVNAADTVTWTRATPEGTLLFNDTPRLDITPSLTTCVSAGVLGSFDASSGVFRLPIGHVYPDRLESISYSTSPVPVPMPVPVPRLPVPGPLRVYAA